MTVLHKPKYAPHLPPILAGLNRTGSVGKTTLAQGLCTQAALRGYKVLGVDADNQGDLSFWNGYDTYKEAPQSATVHDVMLGKAGLKEAIVPALLPDNEVMPGFDLVLGDKNMTQADSELAGEPLGVLWLQSALRNDLEEGEYDLIWVDCPASMGLLSTSLILACTNIIVCLKPTLKELRGSDAITDMINDVRAHPRYSRDHGASAEASFYWMNEARKNKSQGRFYLDVQEQAKGFYGDKLLPQIGQVGQLAEAYAAREPIAIFSPRLPVVQTFNSMLDRLGFPAKQAA